MNYIITKNKEFFEKIAESNNTTFSYCGLEEMVLPKVLAVDTETTSLSPVDGDIFAVQIGTGKNNYLIDCQDHNNGHEFIDIQPYLEDKKLIFHNATFDLGFFYKYGFFPREVHDTFLASKLLHVGAPFYIRHGFGFVMERELKVTYDKSEQKNINVVQLRTLKSINYCFNDVDRLIELAKVLVNKIIAKDMLPTYNLHRNYARALAYVEQCGLPISKDRWANKVVEDKKSLEEMRIKVVDYIYDTLPKFRDLQLELFDNGTKKILPELSAKQMIPVFEELGINVLNKDGKKSTKMDVLRKTKHEFVDMWKGYQDFNHDCSTYGENISDKIIDGRIYTTYNPILNTARISTRKSGINFLNFPSNEKTRRCFVASKGYKLIGCDYDGQENVVGSDLHNDPMMVASILEGKDLHCAFARMLFPELENVSDAEIKKNHSDKRKYAKSPRFAFAYGGNGYTVSQSLNIPIEEGYKIENMFKELHSGVYEWGKEVFEEAIKVGYIKSADGFRLHLEYFDEFKKLDHEINDASKEFWQQYREGKKQFKKLEEMKEALEQGLAVPHFEVYDTYSYNVYMDNKSKVSQYFSKKSAYERLCLNNPVQTTSAHQTKAAVIKIFDTILDEGDVWKAKICVVPHDEVLMETLEELADKYRVILEDAMVNEGNKYLKSGIVKMGATAEIGDDWYQIH